jgi:hypothetical protein
MYYLTTIGIETENEKSGSVKLQKVKFLVEAESVEETTIIANKYIASDTRTCQLLAINHMPIECVISPLTYAELYKGSK